VKFWLELVEGREPWEVEVVALKSAQEEYLYP
jgi:hypothetical protein